MTFITRVTLQSGNRPALDRIVSDVRNTVERKGAEMRGPHSEPPTDYRVPQHKTLSGHTGQQFRSWEYTVYTRELEIVGHNGVARAITDQEFPDGVHVEVEIEQVQPMGN